MLSNQEKFRHEEVRDLILERVPIDILDGASSVAPARPSAPPLPPWAKRPEFSQTTLSHLAKSTPPRPTPPEKSTCGVQPSKKAPALEKEKAPPKPLPRSSSIGGGLSSLSRSVIEAENKQCILEQTITHVQEIIKQYEQEI